MDNWLKCVAEKHSRFSEGLFFITVSSRTSLIHDPRAGMTREGKGKAVEQISRDLRVLVVGGGSEEILEDMSTRSILSSSVKVRSKL